MGEQNPLINLGDLSRPATVLIEKISDALGVIYKPVHVKRMAKAEAEAKKIAAINDLEINEIERRGLARLVAEEGKKQKNIEDIIREALKNLQEEAKPENIEEDWISHFFDRCKLVSDKEMQSLWSNLLSGEANDPGTYSKRTIEVISTLERYEAQLFTSLCSYSIRSGEEIFLIILDVQNDVYAENGINFVALSHLDDIGLIKFDNVTGFVAQEQTKTAAFEYFNIPLLITFQNNSNNNLELGKALLTKTGKELVPICGAKPSMEFLNYLVDEYRKKGQNINSPLPNDLIEQIIKNPPAAR